MSNPLLSFQNISVSYGSVQVLHQVSLEINENEIVTLIGANGSGKSTLMMSLFSLPPIIEGSIFYRGKPIHQLPTHEISTLGITIAPEGRRIFSKMTIEDNLLMGAMFLSPPQRKANLEKMYALFPILPSRRYQRAGTLSGGEQQMLSMGRALMSSPKLFLVDEPSLGLAPRMVKHIFSILEAIAKSGTTIFLVEQNVHEALKIADRGYLIANGEIQVSGKASELRNDPHIQEAYLGI